MRATLDSISHIILCLPAYNEGHSIAELLKRAEDALTREGIPWTIIVTDDGSSDNTAAATEEVAKTRPNIKLVRHPKNRGLGPAIITGMKTALEIHSGDHCMIVCMDADLTHPPELIATMQQTMENGADLVIASRFQPGSEVIGLSPFRHLLSWGARKVFDRALRLTDVRDYTCGFRAFRASLIQRAFGKFGNDGLITRHGFACTDELLIKLALLNPRIREVPFVLRYDLKRGKSKIKLWLTIRETFKLIGWAKTELRSARRSGN